MIRRVLVYRAEQGAQGVFGGQNAITPPEERRPFETFTVRERDIDKARKLALDFVQKRYGERPSGASILADGSLSITLSAPRS